VRSLKGNLGPEPWCIDWTIVRSLHQGQGLRFPCNGWTDEVKKSFIMIMTFLALKKTQEASISACTSKRSFMVMLTLLKNPGHAIESRSDRRNSFFIVIGIFVSISVNVGHFISLSFRLFFLLWIMKLALAVALFRAHTKEVPYAGIFLSFIEKIVNLVGIFFICTSWPQNSKELPNWENFLNAWSLQENLTHSIANQSVHSHVIKNNNQWLMLF